MTTLLTPALTEPGKCVCTDVVPKEMGRRTTHSEKERKSSGERRELRRREGEYWLVPPFLIGASRFFVVYITVQCIYLHCYTVRSQLTPATLRPAARLPYLPTIIIHDDGQC